MTVTGREHIPEGPFVVAANHLSHVDPPFVGTAIRRPMRFMAAADLQGANRPLDFFLGFYGTIPLPRSGVPFSAMKTALHHLAGGGSVGVFPEGRRAAEWGHDDPYEGAAWLALRSESPLVPVAVQGTPEVMGLEARMIRPSPVTVSILPPLSPQGTRRELTAAWVSTMSSVLGAG
jgi:1-acyl-sn-glycerol-3-phosphate acyltransferase